MIEDKFLKAREVSGHTPTTFMVQASNVNYDQNGVLMPLQDEVDSIERRLAEKQPLHAALTSISGLSTSADKMIYTTSSNTYAVTPLTSLARNLLDDTTQLAMRNTIEAISASDTVACAISDQEGTNIKDYYSKKSVTVSSIGTPNASYKSTVTKADNTTSTLDLSSLVMYQKVSSTNAAFPILLTSGSGQTSDTRSEISNYNTGVTVNPSTKTITATTFSGALSGNATTATTLKDSRRISVSLSTAAASGTTFNGSTDVTVGVTGTLPISSGGTGQINGTKLAHYGLCSIAGGTVAKSVTSDGFSKVDGSQICVYFSNTNSATNPTLNVNSTGAFPMYDTTGVRLTGSALVAGMYQFVYYNSAYYQCRVQTATSTIAGTMKLYTDISSSNTDGAPTQSAVKTALAGKMDSNVTVTNVVQTATTNSGSYPILIKGAANSTNATTTTLFSSGVTLNPSTKTITATTFAGTADKATGDSNGDNIRSTYVKSVTVSNGTMTVTKGDGTTSTATVSTTISDASTSTKGIVKIGNNISVSSGTISLTSANVIAALGYTPASGTGTDENVKQVNSTSATAYPILLKNGTGTGTTTSSTLFSSNITVNPGTGTITATTFSGTATNATSATSAGTLSTGRTIDGVTFNGSAAISHYGSTTSAATATTKTVSCTGFSLVTGARILIYFPSGHTGTSLSLNVNSTGAKTALYNGATLTGGILEEKGVYEFVYDGTQFRLVNDPSGTITSKMSEYIKIGDAVSSATTANTLNTSATINGLLYNGSTNVNNFASCSTAAATQIKAVTINNFSTSLVTGLQATIKFTIKNTASNPQLKINSLAAKNIQYRGYNIPAGALAQNSIYTFVYTGTYWEIVGSVTWAE